MQVKATHLIGGSMDYEYIGVFGNFVRYKITLTLYRDCSPNVTTQLDGNITLGVYNNDFNNSKYQNFNINLTTPTKKVNPPQGTNCPNSLSVCIEEGIYTRTIDLPKSTQGYHLMFARCCRNNNQVNIPDQNGQTYYAFIPPTNTINSSPTFKGVPAPYICVNDSSTYLNSATDADGDSLSYKIVTPWLGGSSTNPVPTPPNNLFLPLATVTYRPGFSGVFPFATNGFSGIEATTGLTTMYAPQQGLYSMAIEVTEWRNGVALSTVRRDVQIIAIKCENNNKPNIYPLQGSVNKTVEAGDSICFDIRSTDFDKNVDPDGGPDKDQIITIEADGDLFGSPSWQGPTATFTKKTSTATVTSEFCWVPSCSQASTVPYTFVVNAVDDGCPPKNRNLTFSIEVKPFPGQLSFGGPHIVCANDTGKIYSTTIIPDLKYQWEVLGGSIIGSDTDASVKVNWDIAGQGALLHTQTSKFGCKSPKYQYDVTIGAYPAKVAFPPDTVCEFSNNNLYEVTETNGSNYTWFAKGGIIESNPQPYQATVKWGGVQNAYVGMFETTKHGCIGDSNFKPIAITKPLADSIYGSQSVCPNIKGLEYIAYNGAKGSTYQWTVDGGTIVSENGNDTVIIDWGGIGNGKVTMVETTKWGCIGNIVVINIIKNHVLQGFKPFGKDSMCEYTNGIPYSVVNTKGSEYFWDTKGGTIVKDDTTHNVIVDWGKFGDAEVSVYEISYDSVNNIPCIGAPVTLDIVLHPIPTADLINGDFQVCEWDIGKQYTLNGFKGSTYDWKINNDVLGFTGQGTKTISVNIIDTGKYTIDVIETSQYGCVGDKVDSIIKITPKPKTSPIIGSDIVCFPNFSPIQYFTSGLDNSVFNWFINSGTIDSGNTTNTIFTTFSGQNYNTIKVVEISEAGCIGDTVSKDVFADNPILKMNFVSVGLPDNFITLNWDLKDAPLYNKTFSIERRSLPITEPDAPWRTVGTIPKNISTFNDTNIFTDGNPYQYRIKGTNLCNANIYSDIHENIFLKVIEPERFESQIDWTKYIGWDNGVRNYEVYRQNDAELEFLFSKDAGTDTTSRFDDGLNNFVQRYRVKSWENSTTPDTSWSNEVEIKFAPVLWVPNAFTPNDDGYNPKFVIVQGAVKTFEIEILNRWGESLFKSDNTLKSWDGTYKGQPCPEGVYVYLIRYTGGNNLIKILKGNITLIR
jgi:gliding motility-associated-like protein